MQPGSTTPPDTTNYLNTTIGEVIQKIQILPREGVYVAVAIGVLLIIVGWFGGTRFNLKQISFSVVIVLLVGFFSLPIPAFVLTYLLRVIPPAPALIIVYFFWVSIMLVIALSLYETWIVTIKEQFGSGR